MVPWQTSLVIFFITVFYSMVVCCGFFFWAQRSQNSFKLPAVPAVLIVPLVLIFGFNILSKDLTFPSGFTSSVLDEFLGCIFPATTLFIASGLGVVIPQKIAIQMKMWRNHCFVLSAKSFGISPWKTLGKPVAVQSFFSGWSLVLPVLFSEWVVIEALFNVPGVGWGLWQSAKAQNISQFIWFLLPFLGLLCTCQWICFLAQKNLGKKLSTYH